MQKNYRCPGCNATMEYFPETQKMYCKYCGTSYAIEDLRRIEEEEEQEMEVTENVENPDLSSLLIPSDDIRVMQRNRNIHRRQATIKMKIMRCTSCGAELAVNGVQVSYFCAYCGQSTVVLDRVEEYLKPDYVIPFSVTKEEAMTAIQKKFRSGFFVPKEIRNFEIERLRGIYIPFWLYDVYYGDSQYWEYSSDRGNSSATRYSYRLGDCHYKKMTLDASEYFDDGSSQRLEPYYMEGLKKFDPMYLSGFYADRFDVGILDTEDLAVQRAKQMFDEAMEKSVKHRDAKLVHKEPVCRVLQEDYALLPVWFLSFCYEDIPYTVLVNGQTGKIVGAVPFDKKKTFLTVGILTGMLSLFFVPFSIYLTNVLLTCGYRPLTGACFVALSIMIAAVWQAGYVRFKNFMTSLELTHSKMTDKFVKERQGKAWESS